MSKLRKLWVWSYFCIYEFLTHVVFFRRVAFLGIWQLLFLKFFKLRIVVVRAWRAGHEARSHTCPESLACALRSRWPWAGAVGLRQTLVRMPLCYILRRCGWLPTCSGRRWLCPVAVTLKHPFRVCVWASKTQLAISHAFVVCRAAMLALLMCSTPRYFSCHATGA